MNDLSPKKKPNIYFITGTDTGIGKTFVTLKLMEKAKHQGKTVLGLKPISTGCKKTKEGLVNDDALKLQDASTLQLPYSQINPFAFEHPIAPHLAARSEGQTLNVKSISQKLSFIFDLPIDEVYIEGVGGLLVPLNTHEMLPDLISRLQVPIILIVGIKLGCLNHALLTVSAIKKRKLVVTGWIANFHQSDRLFGTENINYLQDKIPWPLLQIIEFSP